MWSLYQETKAFAEKEEKTPVIGLQQNHQAGLLIVMHDSDMLTVFHELIEAKYGLAASKAIKALFATFKKTKELSHRGR